LFCALASPFTANAFNELKFVGNGFALSTHPKADTDTKPTKP